MPDARRIAARTFALALDAERLAWWARRRDLRAVILNYHIMHRHEMREHLDILEDLFELVPYDEAVDRAGRALAPGRRVPAALTFDDGKRSHLTEAAAVLRERGLHATFFITAGPSASGSIHWFDLAERVRRALDGHRRGTSEVLDLPPAVAANVRALAGELVCNADAGAGLSLDVGRWKKMDATTRDRTVRALADLLEIEPGPIDDDEKPLTPDEVGALAELGFGVGSHSVSHPILTLEDAGRVWQEVSDSRAKLGEWIGRAVQHFCYPNGNHSAATEAATRRAGYETACVTDPVWLGPAENPHLLPRVQIFEPYDRAEIALKVMLATIGLLPNPDGTGRAYRSERTLRRAA